MSLPRITYILSIANLAVLLALLALAIGNQIVSGRLRKLYRERLDLIDRRLDALEASEAQLGRRR